MFPSRGKEKYTRLKKLSVVSSVCPGDGETESDCGKGVLAFIQPARHILKALSWGGMQWICGSTVVAWAGMRVLFRSEPRGVETVGRGSGYGCKVVIQVDPALCVRAQSRLLAPWGPQGHGLQAVKERTPTSRGRALKKLVVLTRLPLSLLESICLSLSPSLVVSKHDK